MKSRNKGTSPYCKRKLDNNGKKRQREIERERESVQDIRAFIEFSLLRNVILSLLKLFFYCCCCCYNCCCGFYCCRCLKQLLFYHHTVHGNLMVKKYNVFFSLNNDKIVLKQIKYNTNGKGEGTPFL